MAGDESRLGKRLGDAGRENIDAQALVRRCRSINDNVKGSRPAKGAAVDGSEEEDLALSDGIVFEVGDVRFREEDDDEESTVEGGGTADDNGNEG